MEPYDNLHDRQRFGRAVTALIAALMIMCVISCCGGWDWGVVQHRVSSPDGRITAVVVRDDCGATCGCMMRVDLELGSVTVEEIYRSFKACDAIVTWEGPALLHIRDDAGGEAQITLRRQQR